MTNPKLPTSTLARVAGLLVLSLACASSSHATPTLANAFAARCPASGTRTAAGCNTCHAGSASVNSLNAYGRDLHTAAAATADLRLAAIEGIDSDKEGHGNLVEINASTQPGWCVATTPGCDNNVKDIDRLGIAAVTEQAISIATHGTAGVHVSFDLDACDPTIAPGVGTLVKGGLDYREAHMLMEMVADSGALLSLDLVEVNPVLDTQNVTAALGTELALSALGMDIL